MSTDTIPMVERELVEGYLRTRWARSRLQDIDGAPEVPDPGFGRDEICPILWFDAPFKSTSEADVSAVSSFAARELRGFEVFELSDIVGGAWEGQVLPLYSDDGESWRVKVDGADQDVAPDGPLSVGSSSTFDSAGGPFTASVGGGWLHGVGFLVINLAEVGPGGTQGRGFYDNGPNGLHERRVQLSLLYALPEEQAIVTAEAYSAAAFALFNGVVFRRDPGAPPSTPQRRMVDLGFTTLRQYPSFDPPPVRATFWANREDEPWQWWLQQIVLRRQFIPKRAGRQTPQ